MASVTKTTLLSNPTHFTISNGLKIFFVRL